ncbi:hypothetical protein OIU74_012205 [Salix koriyanagi]|uniref:Uncharacterized protein n=1 Tax=Salix koriyanagi TaxID=2511006 RepID=A0A9Q0Q6I7_9ROSI|nr:hypothetical protein OIU74_012205 [Salix koriyanagi]
MAPHGEAIASAYTRTNAFSKPPRLSNGNLHRAKSDLTFELSKETADISLPPISEFLGKWVCGLCSEAVKEEMEKNGGHKEEALNEHMSACARFNKFGRAFPVLSQAEAMREILKKSAIRAKSISPKGAQKMGGIARSSSCIAAITRDMNHLQLKK